MAVIFEDFKDHLYHLYHIDEKTVEEISEIFNMKIKLVIENLLYFHIIDDINKIRRGQKVKSIYFFINHTKKAIIRTNNNAPENISDALFTSIIINKWSLSDTIQLINYNTDSKILHSKIKEGYNSNELEWF
jgi:hypothetical protein